MVVRNYLKMRNGERNPKIRALSQTTNQQPRELFDYGLGMVTGSLPNIRDIRYKQYVNTGNNTREGMFFSKVNCQLRCQWRICQNGCQYVIYLRDEVGRFGEMRVRLYL